jgi:diguanylate cyclase (GGDEF)-like protein
MQDGSYARAGDCVGELSLLRKTSIASTVSASESTRVLIIDRGTAWTLIRASHEIARNWLSLFADRTDAVVTIGGNVEIRTSHGHLETQDARTGLHNRQWLESVLPRQMARSVSGAAPLSLLIAEIDNFADYLVRAGTDAGDRVCRAMADALTKNVRPTDLSACYGRGQFAIVLPGADVVDACRVAEHVRQAMSRAGSSVCGQAGSILTVSVGATQLQPPTDVVLFLAAAESALQMARSSGGNRVGMRSTAT